MAQESEDINVFFIGDEEAIYSLCGMQVHLASNSAESTYRSLITFNREKFRKRAVGLRVVDEVSEEKKHLLTGFMGGLEIPPFMSESSEVFEEIRQEMCKSQAWSFIVKDIKSIGIIGAFLALLAAKHAIPKNIPIIFICKKGTRGSQWEEIFLRLVSEFKGSQVKIIDEISLPISLAESFRQTTCKLLGIRLPSPEFQQESSPISQDEEIEGISDEGPEPLKYSLDNPGWGHSRIERVGRINALLKNGTISDEFKLMMLFMHYMSIRHVKSELSVELEDILVRELMDDEEITLYRKTRDEDRATFRGKNYDRVAKDLGIRLACVVLGKDYEIYQFNLLEDPQNPTVEDVKYAAGELNNFAKKLTVVDKLETGFFSYRHPEGIKGIHDAINDLERDLLHGEEELSEEPSSPSQRRAFT